MWFKGLRVLIIKFVGVAGHEIVGVGFKEVDLKLEFVGIGPVVVTLAVGNVFSVGVHDGIHDATYRVAWFVELVLGLVNGFDDVGVTLGILADDGRGAIGRGIVVDNGLEGEGGLLHHKAVEALP